MSDNRARSIISARLQQGEKLLWFDRPSPWLAARGPLFLTAFMTIWTGIGAATFSASSQKSDAWWPLLLFGVIGVALWIGAFKAFLDCWRTAYALTDRRVIVAIGLYGKTDSFNASPLSKIARTGDGTYGTLRFDLGPKGEDSTYRAAFYGIKDAVRVESKIYETLLSQKTKGAPT